MPTEYQRRTITCANCNKRYLKELLDAKGVKYNPSVDFYCDRCDKNEKAIYKHKPIKGVLIYDK